MEAVRKYIDAEKLMTVVSLPKAMHGKKLEIIVMPTEESKDVGSDERNRIEAIVDSLVGIIPDGGMTLDEYREERLRKYETVD